MTSCVAQEASGAAGLPQPPSIRVEENMLRAGFGKQVSLALAAILAGAVVGLAFTDVAQAGHGGGGGFHGGGAAVSMAAVAFVPLAVVMVAAAFIPLVVFGVGAFVPCTLRRAGEAVTAYA